MQKTLIITKTISAEYNNTMMVLALGISESFYGKKSQKNSVTEF